MKTEETKQYDIFVSEVNKYLAHYTEMFKDTSTDVAELLLPYGLAVLAMSSGCKVARSGWNGKGMWVKKVKVGTFDINYSVAEDLKLPTNFFVLKSPRNGLQAWVPSSTDAIAKDWYIVVD